MVKGMLSIHVGVVSSLGHVALSPSSCMSTLPLHCCHVSYPGCVIVPRWCRLVVVFAGVVVASSLSSSRVLVMSFLCRGLLVLCLSRLSCHHPCPSCVVVVPHRRSIVVLCVSKVGWDEWGGVLTGVPHRRLCPFAGAGHHLCLFLGVLRHLGLHWWSLWLVTWRCHIAIGCSVVGCVLWL